MESGAPLNIWMSCLPRFRRPVMSLEWWILYHPHPPTPTPTDTDTDTETQTQKHTHTFASYNLDPFGSVPLPFHIFSAWSCQEPSGVLEARSSEEEHWVVFRSTVLLFSGEWREPFRNYGWSTNFPKFPYQALSTGEPGSYSKFPNGMIV